MRLAGRARGRRLAAGLAVFLMIAAAVPATAAAQDTDSTCGKLDFGCKTTAWLNSFTGLDRLKDAVDGKDDSRSLLTQVVSMPHVGDAREQPGLVKNLGFTQAMGLGLIPLLLVVSAMRYWTAGIVGVSSYTAAMAVSRSAVAIGGIVAFRPALNGVQGLFDAITGALVDASALDVGQRLYNILHSPNFGLLGIIAAFGFFVIMFMKVMLGALLAVLFLLAPIAIAFYVLEETAWLGRGTLQGIFGLLLFAPTGATVLMAWSVFDAIPENAFPGAPFLAQMANAFLSLGALYLLYKLPVTIVRQAGLGSATPAPSRLLAGLAFARLAGGRGMAPRAAPPPRTSRGAPARTPVGTVYTPPGGGPPVRLRDRERDGSVAWDTQGGAVRLRQPQETDGRVPRQQRDPNIEQITPGDAPPGRHRARPGDVRLGANYYHPAGATGSGAVTRMPRDSLGNPLAPEPRRFDDLKEGQPAWTPSSQAPAGAPPPMSDLPRHGAKELIDSRPANPETGAPTREYYEPLQWAKDAGIKGPITRTIYEHHNGYRVDRHERWSADYRDPVTGQKFSDLGTDEIRWVLGTHKNA